MGNALFKEHSLAACEHHVLTINTEKHAGGVSDAVKNGLSFRLGTLMNMLFSL